VYEAAAGFGADEMVVHDNNIPTEMRSTIGEESGYGAGIFDIGGKNGSLGG
jgi:hypothetical protein